MATTTTAPPRPMPDPVAADRLYRRFSARLAALAADRMAAIGPDSLLDVEDITQDVWALAIEGGLDADAAGTWTALAWLVDHVVANRARSGHHHREVPVGLNRAAAGRRPVVPVVPVLPLLPQLRRAVGTPAADAVLLAG